jgi:peptide/nickel transport system ATP-binding protein
LVNVRRVGGEEEATSNAAPVLEVRDVTASYVQSRDALVLEEVSVSIPPATTLAVVGESGSGKSTLARVITGLLPPLEGEISFQGRALSKALKGRSRDQLRELQMIYQMPDVALNPRQRVGEIIGRPLEFYFGVSGREKREQVKDLLAHIELGPEFADRFPGELSGGQKQRVCIARALAAKPSLIICDEVTSALDQLVAEGILKLLDRLQAELGLAYMFITHDLATVRAIADEVIVMLQGKIVEKGPKEEMFTPPHHEYTDLLLSSVPEMDPNWLDELMERRARGGVMQSTSTS